MSDYFAVYVYVALVTLIALAPLLLSGLFGGKKEGNEVKYMPYESGMKTETNIFSERFTLHHYLVALVFLIFDVEVLFLFPWAVVGKALGPFAFYEMAFFIVAFMVGFVYIWRKGGLQWQ